MEQSEPEGINKEILKTLRKNRRVRRRFDLRSIDQQLIEFLSESGFDKRKELAISMVRAVLKKHGKENPLAAFSSRLSQIEIGIQQFSPYLRDHVTHSTYVFLLGLFFMNKVNKIEKKVQKPLSWKLAALLHDIGYPVELFARSTDDYLKRINALKTEIPQRSGSKRSRLHYAVNILGLEELSSGQNAFKLIENRLGEWGIELKLKKIFNQKLKRGIIDHGILSALVVLNIIDALYTRYNPEHLEESVVVEGIDWNIKFFRGEVLDAVTAIAIHNLLEKIVFEEAPLAYLLVLSDILQEWDRYSAGQRVYDPYSVKIEFSKDNIILCKLNLPEMKYREIKNVIEEKLKAKAFQIKCETKY